MSNCKLVKALLPPYLTKNFFDKAILHEFIDHAIIDDSGRERFSVDAFDRFDDAAAAFHQKYPNLQVERLALEGNYNDKMFAMFAGNCRAAFVEHARESDVTAEPDARAAWRTLCQIRCIDVWHKLQSANAVRVRRT